MSRLMLVIGLAPILAPSLGGLVLGFTSWRGIFVVLAAARPCCSWSSPCFGLRETLPVTRRRPATLRASLASYRSLLRDRVFVALTFVGGSMMAAIFAYVSGASFVLQDGFGLDARTFALVFGLNSVGLTLTAQLNPVMLRRFTVRQVLSGAIVLAHGGRGRTAPGRADRRSAGWSAVLVPMALLVSTRGPRAAEHPGTRADPARRGSGYGGRGARLRAVRHRRRGRARWSVPSAARTAAPMGAVMLAVTGVSRAC